MTDQVVNQQIRPIARGLKPPPLPKFADSSQNVGNITTSNPRRPLLFKTNVLQFNSPKKARISHFENGPFSFYLQMIDLESEFKNLQARLKKTELVRINTHLETLGMACLVRHDNKIFRAAVAKIPHPSAQNCVVNLVDYGSNVTVKLENVFYIPEDIVQFTFAMPFSLAGVRKGLKVSDKEISVFFKHLTENRIVTIKCVKSDGPPICQYCELFLDGNINIVDKLRQWDPYSIKYRPQSKLEINSIIEAKVCYVESASEFYVHIQSPEIIADYDATCDELYQTTSELVVHGNPKVGCCCAILLTNELYRGIIVAVLDNQRMKVQIVDYGIIEEIQANHVFLLPEHLAKKAPFAYKCCLVGFEGQATSENISTQFDIFCGDGRGDRKVFKMTVEKTGNINFVSLEDDSVNPPVNVNKMLLKNSRPLIETIQMENAKKRQKDGKNRQENSPENSEIQNRANQPARSSRGNKNSHNNDKSHRSFFGKSPKSEKNSKESTPIADTKNNVKPIKSNRQNNNKSSDLKSGWVSTLSSINRAFVHYDEHIEGLEKILDEMFAFYENKHSRQILKDIKIGGCCAARSSDSNWYRSRIESVNGDKVKVFYREYGNSETLHKSKLRVLDEKFSTIGDLVISTYFAIKTDNEKALMNELTKIFDEGSKEFHFKIIERFRDGWILEPIDMQNGKNVIDELVKAKKAQKITASELSEILSEKPEKPKENVKQEKQKSPVKNEKKSTKKEINVNKSESVKKQVKSEEMKNDENSMMMKVKLTALTSPTEFYITQLNESANFQKLHSDIQIISSGAPSLEDFSESVLCLAKQPFDLQWYRAKIIDSDDMITVRCLDDGKTFSVEDKKLLKAMPAALEDKQNFAILCSLPLVVERKSEESATEILLKLMENEFLATEICRNDDKTFIELVQNEQNVVDLLVGKNLAKRSEIVPNGKAFTSHINSLTSFYLQLELDQLKLDVISSFFEESKGNFKSIEGKKGDIVAALYPEDDCWYRSRIDDVKTDGSYSVTFIDYGNSCDVEKIGKIEESTIADLPGMSKHCALHTPKDFHTSDEMEEKFNKICANGATILDICMKKPGNPVEIEMQVNGKNILESLTS